MMVNDLRANVSQESVRASISERNWSHCSLFCGPNNPRQYKQTISTIAMKYILGAHMKIKKYIKIYMFFFPKENYSFHLNLLMQCLNVCRISLSITI